MTTVSAAGVQCQDVGSRLLGLERLHIAGCITDVAYTAMRARLEAVPLEPSTGAAPVSEAARPRRVRAEPAAADGSVRPPPCAPPAPGWSVRESTSPHRGR